MSITRYTLILLICSLLITACSSSTDSSSQDPELLDLLRENPEYSAFYKLLTETGLIDELNPEADFTLFVPENSVLEEAVESDLSTQELTEILRYHISPLLRRSDQLQTGQVLSTLDGDSIFIIAGTTNRNGDYLVNLNAMATLGTNRVDDRARNAFIHQIDHLLLPDRFGTIAANIKKRLELSRIQERFEIYGLLEMLDDAEQEFTVFAPIDSGFNFFFGIFLQLSEEQLNLLFKNHIVEGAVVFDDFPAPLNTLAGFSLLNFTIGDDFFIELNRRSQTLEVDIIGSNGVIHIVDTLLLPDEFLEDIE